MAIFLEVCVWQRRSRRSPKKNRNSKSGLASLLPVEVPMDTLELLKQDHQKVKELFEQAEQAQDKKHQKRIFREIKTELETHARIEENIFYPAMQEHGELKDMVLESREEHKQMKTVLQIVRDLSRSSKS
jgi:hemerythrin superfamily protein